MENQEAKPKFWQKEKNNPLNSVALAGLLLVAFMMTIFWTGGWGLLLLVWLLLSAFALALFYPLPALAAMIVLRTATDFLTDQEVFQLGAWSINFTSLAGLLVIIFALFIFLRHKGWREKIPLSTNWLLFLIAAVILTLWSINFKSSLVEILRWSSFFALFVLGFFLGRGGERTTIVIKTLIFSSVIPVLVSLNQALSGGGFFDGTRWRVNGTFVHPNMLGFYLVYILTLSLFIFLTLKKQAIEKYFYLLFSLPLFAALILTYTRGAWVALAVILVLIGLFRFRLFLFSSLVVLIMFYALFSPFQERVNSLISFSASDSTVWRLDLWRDALGYAQNRPWTGYGPGTAIQVIGQNRPVTLGSSEPHNDYVKILLETGLIGLFFFALLILSLWSNLWRGYRQEESPRRQLLFMFLLIFSFSFYLMSAGDNLLKDSSLQWSFWVLIGALMFRRAELKEKRSGLGV